MKCYLRVGILRLVCNTDVAVGRGKKYLGELRHRHGRSVFRDLHEKKLHQSSTTKLHLHLKLHLTSHLAVAEIPPPPTRGHPGAHVTSATATMPINPTYLAQRTRSCELPCTAESPTTRLTTAQQLTGVTPSDESSNPTENGCDPYARPP